MQEGREVRQRAAGRNLCSWEPTHLPRKWLAFARELGASGDPGGTPTWRGPQLPFGVEGGDRGLVGVSGLQEVRGACFPALARPGGEGTSFRGNKTRQWKSVENPSPGLVTGMSG